METVGSLGLWAGFAAIVLVMLAIDLFVVGGGKEHRVSFREAATWSVIWISRHAGLCRRPVVVPRRRHGARDRQ